MNLVAIMGRLTKKPELKWTPSGTAVTSFTVAVDRGTKDENGYRAVDFIDCVAWRQRAEFVCKYFDKGTMISLQGSLRVRSWETEDAQRRKSVEVLVDRVFFCGGRTAADPEEKQPKNESWHAAEFEDYDDDDELPF